MWIDAHNHLADSRYSEAELRAILKRSRDQGIGLWIQGGVCPSDWERQLEIAQNIDQGVMPCFGLHPEWVSKHSLEEVQEALSVLRVMIPQAVGLGELGLDFRKPYVPQQELQIWACQQQLELALQVGKPLILHCVQAHGKMVELLKKWGPWPQGGLVHSFSGSLEVAREYIKLGLLISVSGAILKDRSEKLRQVIRALPPDHLVIETDSPDQAIDSSLNEPVNLIGIAQVVGHLKEMAPEKLLTESAERLKHLFK